MNYAPAHRSQISLASSPPLWPRRSKTIELLPFPAVRRRRRRRFALAPRLPRLSPPAFIVAGHPPPRPRSTTAVPSSDPSGVYFHCHPFFRPVEGYPGPCMLPRLSGCAALAARRPPRRLRRLIPPRCPREVLSRLETTLMSSLPVLSRARSTFRISAHCPRRSRTRPGCWSTRCRLRHPGQTDQDHAVPVKWTPRRRASGRAQHPWPRRRKQQSSGASRLPGPT